MAPVRFLSLPEELVLAILSHSTPHDLSAVAASCRELAKLSEKAAQMACKARSITSKGLWCAKRSWRCQLSGRIWRAGHRVREREGSPAELLAEVEVRDEVVGLVQHAHLTRNPKILPAESWRFVISTECFKIRGLRCQFTQLEDALFGNEDSLKVSCGSMDSFFVRSRR